MRTRLGLRTMAVAMAAAASLPVLVQPASADVVQRTDHPTAGVQAAQPTQGLTSATSLATANMRGCPKYYVCIWEHSDFSGRMRKFKDSGLQDLRRYGFGDQASSVVNNSGRSFQLVNERRFRHDEYSRRLGSQGQWSNLLHLSRGKNNWNDAADKIYID